MQAAVTRLIETVPDLYLVYNFRIQQACARSDCNGRSCRCSAGLKFGVQSKTNDEDEDENEYHEDRENKDEGA